MTTALELKNESRNVIKICCLSNDGRKTYPFLKEKIDAEVFNGDNFAGLGADFLIKEINKENNSIEFQFWVINIEEGLNNLREQFLIGSVIFFLFDYYNSLDTKLLDEIDKTLTKLKTSDNEENSGIRKLPITIMYIGNIMPSTFMLNLEERMGCYNNLMIENFREFNGSFILNHLYNLYLPLIRD